MCVTRIMSPASSNLSPDSPLTTASNNKLYMPLPLPIHPSLSSFMSRAGQKFSLKTTWFCLVGWLWCFIFSPQKTKQKFLWEMSMSRANFQVLVKKLKIKFLFVLGTWKPSTVTFGSIWEDIKHACVTEIKDRGTTLLKPVWLSWSVGSNWKYRGWWPEVQFCQVTYIPSHFSVMSIFFFSGIYMVHRCPRRLQVFKKQGR